MSLSDDTSIALSQGSTSIQLANDDITIDADSDLSISWDDSLIIQGETYVILTGRFQVGGGGPPKNVQLIGKIV